MKRHMTWLHKDEFVAPARRSVHGRLRVQFSILKTEDLKWL